MPAWAGTVRVRNQRDRRDAGHIEPGEAAAAGLVLFWQG